MPFHDGQHGPREGWQAFKTSTRLDLRYSHLQPVDGSRGRGWFHRLCIWMVTRQPRNRTPW